MSGATMVSRRPPRPRSRVSRSLRTATRASPPPIAIRSRGSLSRPAASWPGCCPTTIRARVTSASSCAYVRARRCWSATTTTNTATKPNKKEKTRRTSRNTTTKRRSPPCSGNCPRSRNGCYSRSSPRPPRRVGRRFQFLDIDLLRREEIGDAVDDARVIHGHHAHAIRQPALLAVTRRGGLGDERELQPFLERGQLPLHGGDRLFVAVN